MPFRRTDAASRTPVIVIVKVTGFVRWEFGSVARTSLTGRPGACCEGLLRLNLLLLFLFFFSFLCCLLPPLLRFLFLRHLCFCFLILVLHLRHYCLLLFLPSSSSSSSSPTSSFFFLSLSSPFLQPLPFRHPSLPRRLLRKPSVSCRTPPHASFQRPTLLLHCMTEVAMMCVSLPPPLRPTHRMPSPSPLQRTGLLPTHFHSGNK